MGAPPISTKGTDLVYRDHLDRSLTNTAKSGGGFSPWGYIGQMEIRQTPKINVRGYQLSATLWIVYYLEVLSRVCVPSTSHLLCTIRSIPYLTLSVAADCEHGNYVSASYGLRSTNELLGGSFEGVQGTAHHIDLKKWIYLAPATSAR
jgi:hypothetical protein